MNDLSLGARLGAEAEALAAHWFGAGALQLLGALVGIYVVQAVLRALIRRWGREPSRKDLAVVLALSVRALALIFAVGAVFTGLAAVAPLLTVGGLLLVFFGLAFGVGLRAQSWLLGWGLLLGGRVRIGDELRVGSTRGAVVRLGLMRILLRADDGARVILPTRALSQSTVTLSTPDQTVPLDVRLPCATPVDAEALERARRIAGLCPYRSWLADVSVVAEGDQALRVRLQAWSAPAAQAAEAYLRDELTG